MKARIQELEAYLLFYDSRAGLLSTWTKVSLYADLRRLRYILSLYQISDGLYNMTKGMLRELAAEVRVKAEAKECILTTGRMVKLMEAVKVISGRLSADYFLRAQCQRI